MEKSQTGRKKVAVFSNTDASTSQSMIGHFTFFSLNIFFITWSLILKVSIVSTDENISFQLYVYL